MTTKIVTATAVTIICMTGFWVSLSTKLDINSKASGDISSKLKEQVEAYRDSQNMLLSHVDDTQKYVITALLQSSTLAEQNQKLLASIDQLTNQNIEMSKQNADMLKSIQSVNDSQIKILQEHTQTLQQARNAVNRTAAAAESAQANSRITLRAVVKPTPKKFLGIFALPSPTPRHR